jgi:hypothetical protein
MLNDQDDAPLLLMGMQGNRFGSGCTRHSTFGSNRCHARKNRNRDCTTHWSRCNALSGTHHILGLRYVLIVFVVNKCLCTTVSIPPTSADFCRYRCTTRRRMRPWLLSVCVPWLGHVHACLCRQEVSDSSAGCRNSCVLLPISCPQLAQAATASLLPPLSLTSHI